MTVITVLVMAAVALAAGGGYLLHSLWLLREEHDRCRSDLADLETHLTKTKERLRDLNGQLKRTVAGAAKDREQAQELAAQKRALEEAVPGRVRQLFGAVDTMLGKALANAQSRGSSNNVAAADYQQKREAVRTILHLLIANRLEQELTEAARRYAAYGSRDDLIRDRVKLVLTGERERVS